MRILLLSGIALLLFSCGSSPADKPIVTAATTDTFRNMPEEKEALSSPAGDASPDEAIHVTTQLHYDSISPYFVFSNLSRLDQLDTLVNGTFMRRGKRIVFDLEKPYAHQKDSALVFNPGERYIIGNYPLRDPGKKAVVLLNYMESWGTILELLTVSGKDGHMLALETLAGSCGDAGDYYSQALSGYIGEGTYRYELEESFMVGDASPNKRYKLIESGVMTIANDGSLRKKPARRDSTTADAEY